MTSYAPANPAVAFGGWGLLLHQHSLRGPAVSGPPLNQWSIMTFEQVLDEQLDRMRVIMISRQRKYGPENIKAGGIHGLVVRMRDKLARIEQDHKDCPFLGPCIERTLPDEERDDAWLDLANYAGPIALMVLHGIWAPPLAVSPDILGVAVTMTFEEAE